MDDDHADHLTIRSTVLALPLIVSFVMPLTAASRPSARCSPCFECATEPGHLRVVRVRMYNQSRMSQANVESMLDVTNRLWLPYGVRFETATSADTVTIVVSGNTIPASTGYGPAVLGATLFNQGHATPFIRLWPGIAEGLVSDADFKGRPFRAWPVRERDAILLQVMGVALAHEMGHYLLDTASHSSGGLLQATLTGRDLEYPSPARLWLTVEQQRLLCAGSDTAVAR
jgi:hypothetical protein